jgi:hypothetical protein
VKGDADTPEGRRLGRPWWEFEDVFGLLTGVGLEGELADLEAGPPWQPVASRELAGLFSAYREAQAGADELLAALFGAGLAAGEFPELCGVVDGQGRAVVQLGTVSIRTADRLADVLRARPIPPAVRGKAA